MAALVGRFLDLMVQRAFQRRLRLAAGCTSFCRWLRRRRVRGQGRSTGSCVARVSSP